MTLEFKSIPEYYNVEIRNIKRNTVRFTDDWNDVRWNAFNESNIVCIKNTQTNEIFTREIKHRCTYKNIVIISW